MQAKRESPERAKAPGFPPLLPHRLGLGGGGPATSDSPGRTGVFCIIVGDPSPTTPTYVDRVEVQPIGRTLALTEESSPGTRPPQRRPRMPEPRPSRARSS